MLKSAKSVKISSDLDIKSFTRGDDQVCVVAIIGKSRVNVQETKASRVNSLIGGEVFLSEGTTKTSHNGRGLCEITAYHDPDHHTLFLELQSPYDFCSRIRNIKDHNNMDEEEEEHVRALLFLFSVSHLVILVSPSPNLDISWIKLFEIVDITREKLQPSVSEILHDLSLPDEWITAGRPCSPRVLFVFENCPPPVVKAGRSAMTRMAHVLEDQIYRSLRKARIITNISNNSLFAVPANEEYVHVCAEGAAFNNVSLGLSLLKLHCDKTMEADQSKSSLSLMIPPLPEPDKDNDKNAFVDFLLPHIELALSKGFDDNVGRNHIPAVFQLTTVEEWVRVCQTLYAFFMEEVAEEEEDELVQPHFDSCRSMLNIDTRFSESRCKKVFPLAEGVYQEALPQHYTKKTHEKQLLRAKRAFTAHARGPAVDSYMSTLEEKCTGIWTGGRQLCEALSATGNHCSNPLHRTPDDPDEETRGELPTMKHCSDIKTKAACNCGRKQTEREDPFTHKVANYDFYVSLSGICCDTLDSYEFPVFKSSVADAKAAKLSQQTRSTPPVSSSISRKDSNIAAAMSNLSLGVGLSQPSTVDVDSEDDDDNSDDNDTPLSVLDVGGGDVGEGGTLLPCRQHSTTEYLPGMLHSYSPHGLLPQYPEWALLCIGKYNSYSLSHGMEQPGFTLGYNFLLPWDVPVHSSSTSTEKWPTIGENTKKGKNKKKEQKDTSPTTSSTTSGGSTVRVYVGFEYECPRGHRFFSSAPDRVFKAPTSGIFKETAEKVLQSNMPLHCPCSCRNAKGSMAQLMRVHVAVPEGAVEVSINPRVQPAGPNSPVFYPGHDAPIPLPAGAMWVLRLPYVYIGEEGAYTAEQRMNGRLLNPILTATEIPPEPKESPPPPPPPATPSS